MVDDGAFSHQKDYFPFFKETLNFVGHLNRFIGSKVMAIFVELHREGSVPAACSAVFFLIGSPISKFQGY